MHLSEHSLRQLDRAYLDALDEAALRVLSAKLLDDLKEARDRLNQGPETSSRPPSSRAPWERKGEVWNPDADADADADAEAVDGGRAPAPTGAKPAATQPTEAKPAEARPRSICPQHAPLVAALRAACERRQSSDHQKTHALAVELLNDWDAIFQVLHHPKLPLINNEAERALRYWVILRKLGLGTRTAVGSRVVALLASVIDTCRQRGYSPWRSLERAIADRRAGQPLAALPQ
jgi:hypothetical protein